MRTFLMISLILFTSAESAITLSGKAYLQGQTDNSGIKVRFIRTQTTTGLDSTTTAADGSYSITDSAGYYIISYSKAGFFGDSIVETSYYSNTIIADRTLMARTTRINVPAQFSTIQLAVTQANNGDTVLVAPGTYKENIVWSNKNIVLASQMLLTNDSSYIGKTIIDGNSVGSVLTITNVSSPNSLLMGFTITHGSQSASNYYGGGVNCSNSSLTIRHLVLTGNSISYPFDGGGAGMTLIGSNAVVDSVTFSSNYCHCVANWDEGGGSALCCSGVASPIIQNCVFAGNTGDEAICIGEGSNAVIKNSTLYQNSCGSLFTIYKDNQPADVTTSPIFQNDKMFNNNLNWNLANIFSQFSGLVSPVFTNTTVLNNRSLYGMFLQGKGCQGTFSNCDFISNALDSTSWGLLTESSGNAKASITNCIFSGNNSVSCMAQDGAGLVTAANNLFYTNAKSSFANCGAYLGKNVTLNANGDSADAYGNIQANPYFVNSNAGDYHLADWSRAIGAGTATGAPATDIEGTTRGNPPDIGAYENSKNTPTSAPALSAPILVSPIDGSTNTSASFTMQWQSVSSTDHYQIQISPSSNLNAAIVDTSVVAVTLTITPGPSPLSANTTYYWRARAVNGSGPSPWSAVWSFKTALLALRPALVYPADGSINVPIDVRLSWNKVPYATSYNIIMTSSKYFQVYQTTVSDTFLNTYGAVGIGPISEGCGLRATESYKWQVQARTSTDSSNWSNVFGFVTDSETFYCKSPRNGANSVSLTPFFTWNYIPVPGSSISGCTSMRLQLSTISDLSIISFDTIFVNAPPMNECYYSPQHPFNPNTTYYWRVNDGSSTNWSTIWRFTTLSPLPDQITLLSPSNASVIYTDSIALSWNKSSLGVDKYRLEIFTDSLMNAVLLVDSTITDTSKIERSLKNKTSYWWRVSAHNIAGWGSYSDARKFTVNIPTTAVLPKTFSFKFSGMSASNSFIRYSLPKTCNVSFRLFNVQGKLIQTLINANQSAGNYQIPLNIADLSRGCYLMDFKAESFAVKRKMNIF